MEVAGAGRDLPGFIDPGFVDPEAGDYLLKSQSDALNRGSNHIERMPSFDLRGKPRIQDGTVDLGPYEGSAH